MFASITQAVALSKANATKEQVDICLGIHAGDHAIYPDRRQEFRDADDEAFRIGNWEADRVGYFTPYLDTDKLGILQNGEYLCEILEIKFNEVYSRTNTSYKPFPSGTVIISLLHLLNELKHLLLWVGKTLFNMKTKLVLWITM